MKNVFVCLCVYTREQNKDLSSKTVNHPLVHTNIISLHSKRNPKNLQHTHTYNVSYLLNPYLGKLCSENERQKEKYYYCNTFLVINHAR